MNNDDDIDADELVRRIIADIEAFLVEIELRGSDYDARMAVLLSGAALRQVAMDKAVRVEDAIYLPELGGEWTENMEFSVPSQTHAVKTLRSAITSGALGVEKPNSKNHLVTRTMLQEWRESCQEKSTRQASTSVANATTPMVSSPIKRNGVSMTEARELTRASAKATLNSLKRR
tara:strand:+ start:2329 stop:2853 length:525 start_codon:yes stop_codon:yes gene_type:complete